MDLKRTVPAAFTATETFDLGSPVSPRYTDRGRFAFGGEIESVRVELE